MGVVGQNVINKSSNIQANPYFDQKSSSIVLNKKNEKPKESS